MLRLTVTAAAILLVMVGSACQKKANQAEKKDAASQVAEQKGELSEAAAGRGLMAMHTKPFNYTNDAGDKLSGVCFAYTSEALALDPELKKQLLPGDCPEQADIASIDEGQSDVANDLIKSCEGFGEGDKIYGAIRVYSVSFDLNTQSMLETSDIEASALCTDLAPIAALQIKSE